MSALTYKEVLSSVEQLNERDKLKLLGDIVSIVQRQYHKTDKKNNRVLGMFTSEPEIMDEVVNSAMTDRENQRLRRNLDE